MPEVIETGATPTVATPGTATVPQTQAAATVAPDTAAQIANLTESNKSADARIKELNKESLGHRNAREKAEAEALALKEASEAYSKLGKPEELVAVREENATLKAQIAERDRNDTLRTVAGEAYKFSVLKSLDSQWKDEKGNPAVYETRDVIEQGKAPRKEQFVKFHEGGKDAELPLGKFLEAKFPDFLPALRAKAPMGAGAGPTPASAPTQQSTQAARRIPNLF